MNIHEDSDAEDLARIKNHQRGYISNQFEYEVSARML